DTTKDFTAQFFLEIRGSQISLIVLIQCDTVAPKRMKDQRSELVYRFIVTQKSGRALIPPRWHSAPAFPAGSGGGGQVQKSRVSSGPGRITDRLSARAGLKPDRLFIEIKNLFTCF